MMPTQLHMWKYIV